MNIIESIYNESEKWKPTERYFIHDSGAALWIANGFFFCNPENGSFSLLNKWRAWRAYRWWCINAPVEAFGRRVSE